MKTISPALEAHLAGEAQTMASCWLCVRQDETVFAATDHDRDLAFDLESAMAALGLTAGPGIEGTGSQTYRASSGFTASAIQSSQGLNVDTGEAQGMLSSPAITEDDLRAGLWDAASITVFLVNWADLTMGPLIQRTGKLGQVSVERGFFKAEWRGLLENYATTVGELTSPFCSAVLGDARCTKDLTAFTVTGTIDSVGADNRTVHDAARSEAAAYFAGGKMTFDSGANDGLTMEVRSSEPGQWVLQLPMPYTIHAGDTYTMVAGCDHSLGTCRDTFNNVVNFQGFPRMIGTDRLLDVGRHQ